MAPPPIVVQAVVRRIVLAMAGIQSPMVVAVMMRALVVGRIVFALERRRYSYPGGRIRVT